MASLRCVDAIWERWDLVCDPAGCEPLDQLLRAMIYGFVLIALMIFYAAARPWTTNLPTPLGVAIAALTSVTITWLCLGVVTSSPRLVVAVIALGLIATWVGRPAFTQRTSNLGVEKSVDDPLSEGSSPISSTH